MGQPLAYANNTHSATYNDLMQRYRQLRELHEAQIGEIKNHIRQFYLEERASLLQSLSIIFSHTSSNRRINSRNAPMRSLVALRDDLMKDGRAISELIQSLRRNQQWPKEFPMLDESQKRSVEASLQLE
jgi:hypothetical protein